LEFCQVNTAAVFSTSLVARLVNASLVFGIKHFSGPRAERTGETTRVFRTIQMFLTLRRQLVAL
jgi:hypothetical protein